MKFGLGLVLRYAHFVFLLGALPHLGLLALFTKDFRPDAMATEPRFVMLEIEDDLLTSDRGGGSVEGSRS